MGMRTKAGRRAVPVVALLAVIGAVAACGQASPSGTVTPAGGGTSTGPPGASESSVEPTSDATDGSSSAGAGTSASGHGVRLEATFEVGFSQHPVDPGVRRRPGVVVTYTLTRQPGAGDELVAYDMVPSSLGSAELPEDLNPEHAWVYADGDAVRLSKQSFAAATGVSFIAAPMTGVRLIPTTGSLQGRAFAVSPPRLDVPGREFAAPRGALPTGSDQWQFCAQVGERQPGMTPSSAGDDVLEAPARAPEGDELLCTEAVTLDAP